MIQAQGQGYQCYQRARANGMTFNATLWKTQKRHNCTITYLNADSAWHYGQIERFILCGERLSAIVRLFDCSTPFSDTPTDGLYLANRTATLVLVDVARLKKCLYIKIDDKVYFSTLVDIFERD